MHAHRHPKPLTRLVHLLLLLGWLLSSHGIAPAICMTAALIDGDHAVKVGVANDGALTVVLSHEGKSSAELTAHEHDALCRMLLAFAAPPSSASADHVLAFKPVDDTSRTQRPVPSVQCPGKTAAPLQLIVFNPAKTPCTPSAAMLGRSRLWSQAQALKSGRTVMRC